MANNADNSRQGLSDTASKLLAAAEAVVFEQGITGLSVRKVGNRAGVNPALVTYHFGGVAALLEKLAAFNVEPMLEAWERLEAAAAEGLDSLLRAWLLPLMVPSAFTPGRCALIGFDEVAAHGQGNAKQRVMDEMMRCSQRVQSLLSPHCPHLEAGQLRARVRFISSAALGPPPRIHGSSAMGEGVVLNNADFLLRFAKAALAN